MNFCCGTELKVDVEPVRRKFYVSCNSIIARTHRVAEPVRVELIRSFCLPILCYCIGALSLKQSVVNRLAVCWNDAFRRIFNFKRHESVKTLQVNFGLLDFEHLYDSYRWKFLRIIGRKSQYWSHFVQILEYESHLLDKLFDKYYSQGSHFDFMFAVHSHCRSLCGT